MIKTPLTGPLTARETAGRPGRRGRRRGPGGPLNGRSYRGMHSPTRTKDSIGTPGLGRCIVIEVSYVTMPEKTVMFLNGRVA